MAGVKGRSGGPRPGSGGKRPGAGRKKGSVAAPSEKKITDTHIRYSELKGALDELEICITEVELEFFASKKLERTKESLSYARRLIQKSIGDGIEIPEHIIRTKRFQLRVKRLSKSLRTHIDKD